MKLFSLLDIKYHKLTDAVKQYLSKTLSNFNTSYGNNTVFGQLINVLTAVSQNIMLYIEDSLVEQNKYTAQRKKSIYGLAAQTGYNPSLGKAAGVQLSISYIPTNAENTNIIIKNKESVTCTQNGLIYNIILPQEAFIMSVEKHNISKHVYAVQGKFETQNFISTGGKYYTQNVKFIGNMDCDYLEVKINNEKWEYCDSIYDMNPLAKQWTYKTSPTGGIDIIFGNDRHGKSLEADDVINVTYLIHDGELGNIDVNSETYFVFNNNLTDVFGMEVSGNEIFNVTFASKDAVTSGTNCETINTVRQMIGLNSRSLVLTSPKHYKNFLSKFSFCGYNRTWSEQDSMIINSLILKNYKSRLESGKNYFDLNERDFLLSDDQKQSIINYFEKSGCQIAGASYNIINPILCKYALYIYIKPKNYNIDKDYLDSKIKELIGQFFCDLQSDIFIPKSDIIQLLKNNIPEIDGVNVYFLSERNEKAKQEKQYTKYKHIYDSIGSTKIIKETVYLYDGENPNLGLDEHGNIFLESNHYFPVLMGNWNYLNNNNQEVSIIDPLIIAFE